MVLLYETGAVSNKELFLLASASNERGISVRPHTKIADFVSTAASNPRSLQNLCGLKISRLLGTGADRRTRAEKLGLPSLLMDAVLFKDAITQYEKAFDIGQENF